jgi:hypothetical protein
MVVAIHVVKYVALARVRFAHWSVQLGDAECLRARHSSRTQKSFAIERLPSLQHVVDRAS